jgi:hypothetical protein
MVDDEPVEVKVNLHAALRELRRRHLSPIWVDALCINQENMYERGQQVLQMGLIYSRAVEVIMWLGPKEDNSDVAISASSFEVPVAQDRELTPDAALAIFRLFARPYWYHVWQAVSSLL